VWEDTAVMVPPAATKDTPQTTGVSDAILTGTSSFWDRLRRVRANVQGLQTSLAELRKSGPRLDQVLSQEQPLWRENAAQVEQGITWAQTAVEAGGAGQNQIADEIELLDNDWDRTKRYWRTFSDSPATDPGDREAQIGQMDALLRAMVLRLGFLTIPGRVHEYLERQRVGSAFDFHEAFKDELPSKEDRDEVLAYLKASPVGIDGLVDIDHGIIWATSPDPSAQRRSYIITAIIALMGLVATIAACQLSLSGPFVNSRSSELAVAYVAVAGGVIAHIGIDLYKQSRAADRTTDRSAVGDLVLWGHAHQEQMYVTAFSVWAGLIALAFVFAKVEPATAFIAGYGLDSFLDAALLRFSGTLDAGTAAVKRQMATG
jgi:hypothetical protein